MLKNLYLVCGVVAFALGCSGTSTEPNTFTGGGVLWNPEAGDLAVNTAVYATTWPKGAVENGHWFWEVQTDVEDGGLSMIDIHGKKFKPLDTEIEGDWSASAYFDALNTVGGEVEIEGLLSDSVQADKIYPELFRQLREDESPEIDLTNHPDSAPALFVYAALNRGAIFRGLSRFKPKEKLCLEKLAKELSKLNVFLALGEETAIINRSLIKPSSVALNSNGDHRAAMALSILLTVTGGSLEGAEVVNDSVPQFFDLLKSLGVDFKMK